MLAWLACSEQYRPGCLWKICTHCLRLPKTIPLRCIYNAYASKLLIIFCWLIWKTVKNQERIFFYHFLISASVPEIRALKVSEILRRDAKRKLSILCPFNKNCDVTTRISVYSIYTTSFLDTCTPVKSSECLMWIHLNSSSWMCNFTLDTQFCSWILAERVSRILQ